MKKTAIISILIIAFASINLFAEQKQKTEENNKTQQEWNEIGEQGKKALSEAGKFFSSAGKKVLSETEKVLKDGWFYTGDLGYIDKDGYIFISGRKKNMIVLQNGKKVFPEEMEDLINSIDLVDECFVYGMPKEKDVMLSVKIKYDKDKVRELYPEGISDEELEKVIWNKVKEKNKLVPKYKYIKHMILTTEDFIKTSTNKIKRFEEIKKVLNN